MHLVSVIMPSFNGFKILLEAIESVKIQNYKNMGNNCYVMDPPKNITILNLIKSNILHLKENQKEIHGLGQVL